MTDVELDCSRADAVELVTGVFESNPDFVSYTVTEGAEEIVGTTRGTVTSLGEEVVVWIPHEQSETSTAISVTARQKSGFVGSSNPWKYKAAFLSDLRDRKDEPVSSLRRRSSETAADSSGVGRGADESFQTEEPEWDAADVWMQAAKISATLLLVLIGIVVLALVLGHIIP